jgi:capsular exopolysaccharide synthesis family protein
MTPVARIPDDIAALDAPPPSAPGTRLRDIGRILLRRSRLIVGMVVMLNIAAFVVVSNLPVRYTSEASLIIAPRQAQVLDMKAVVAGLSGESGVIESEIQILRSRKIARDVIEKLHLDQDPNFNPALREPGLLHRAGAALKQYTQTALAGIAPTLGFLPQAWQEAISTAADAAPNARLNRKSDAMSMTVDDVLRQLSVASKGRSNVIGIAFTASDPDISAAVANGVAEGYIADQLKAKLDATAKAHKWLEDRVGELRDQVINSDQAVEAYRQRIGVVQGSTGTLMTEQLSQFSDQLIKARVARSNAEARLRAMEAAQTNRRLDSLAEVQGSPVLQALRAQESMLLQQAAQVTHTRGENNPRVGAIRSEVAGVQGRIGAEMARIAGGIRDEARIAAAREQSLVASLDQMRRQAGTSNVGEVELRVLQHEADANRGLYDRLLARSKETNVESGLQNADAQIISRAEAPILPSFPNPSLILPVFFVAICLLTLLLVFALENLDHGFRTLDQVEAALGIAALGVVPRLRRRSGEQGRPESYILQRPGSPYGEAIRNLHTGLMLSNVDAPPKVVLIASALPGEGKTSVALSLARLMASCGKRVVIVDCDLRSPDLHKVFGVPQSPGLVDCLSGEENVFAILRQDARSQAYLVPAGSKAYTSPDLFASGNMRKLLASLAERFDLVILDSAPVLAVSDTRNLCRLADKTVFIVRWQDTRRFAAVPALRQMIEAGGNMAGILLSMVDMPRYAKFTDAAFYQRRINLYLQD